MNAISRITGIAIFLAAAAPAMPALADMAAFKAPLSGAMEVPPTTSKATGMIDATYDTATKKLSWKGTFSGLTGNPTAAHFHGPAEAGKNAGVEVPVPLTASPFEGSAVLTDSQASDFMAGKIYFNVHTAANPNGEIRGQMAKAE